MLQPQGAFGVSPYEEGKRRRQTFHVQRFREKHAHLPVLQFGKEKVLSRRDGVVPRQKAALTGLTSHRWAPRSLLGCSVAQDWSPP